VCDLETSRTRRLKPASGLQKPVKEEEEEEITLLLLTPRSRVLLEKLKRPKLLKRYPAFYGTRRFITAFTTARHLSLT
jgi:hypothetical protein